VNHDNNFKWFSFQQQLGQEVHRRDPRERGVGPRVGREELLRLLLERRLPVGHLGHDQDRFQNSDFRFVLTIAENMILKDLKLYGSKRETGKKRERERKKEKERERERRREKEREGERKKEKEGERENERKREADIQLDRCTDKEKWRKTIFYFLGNIDFGSIAAAAASMAAS
jgi:hypothetical protein